MDGRRNEILVVEDESELRSLCERYLEVLGYDVETAEDGLIALDKARNGPYDVILADIKMPRMDGLDLLKVLVKEGIDSEVIIMTGYGSVEDAVEAMKNGAYDFIVKPFELAHLSKTVKKCLENRTLTKEKERLSSTLTLMELSRTITSPLDLSSIYEKILSLLREAFQPDSISILIVTQDERELELVAASGLPPEVRLGTRVPIQNTISGMVFTKGEPMVFLGPVDDPLHSTLAQRPNIGSSMVVPIKMKEVLGILCLNRGVEAPPFGDEGKRLLTIFASHTAIAIKNATNYRELKELNDQIITALARTVEAKDHYTLGHSERVSQYAVRIAEAMGLDSMEVDRIRTAGLLHDIGKIGIPDSILNKPSSLEHDEYEIIKRHADIGVQILGEMAPLRECLPLIYHHHERYDGKGHPEGLRGEAIPLGARILAVADGFEAMTSSRAYRQAMSVDEALEILQRDAGTQWDERIVRLWLHLCERGALEYLKNICN